MKPAPGTADVTTPRPRTSVLVVDDEMSIRRALRAQLTQAGYGVLEAPDGETGLDLASRESPDAVILDMGLPGIRGPEVVTRLRMFSKVPVIILSVLDRQADKIDALDRGADDYVTKPFSMDELLARLRAALRRIEPDGDKPARCMRAGRIVVDVVLKAIEQDGQPTKLTPTEWSLLDMFLANPGKLLTSKQLIAAIWGQSYGSEASALRIYVSHLRRLIEDVPADPKHLLTEIGAGYRLIGVEPAD